MSRQFWILMFLVYLLGIVSGFAFDAVWIKWYFGG
jgi:hypothetical protein